MSSAESTFLQATMVATYSVLHTGRSRMYQRISFTCLTTCADFRLDVVVSLVVD